MIGDVAKWLFSSPKEAYSGPKGRKILWNDEL